MLWLPLLDMPITAETPLALGSSSPRRREILESLGIPIRIVRSSTSEDRLPSEPPALYLERITLAKLGAAAHALGPEPAAGLLVADTIVVLGDEIFGKPNGVPEAELMLSALSGRSHVVYTRYALSHADTPDQVRLARTVASEVYLRAASPSEIAGYAKTGEGLDKAGSYAAQGIGSFLVERISGSYSNVIGLPACEVVLDLKRVGLLCDFP